MPNRCTIASLLMLAAAFAACRPAPAPPLLTPVAAEHDGVVIELRAAPGDRVTRNQILLTTSWPLKESDVAATLEAQQTAEQTLAEAREQYLRLAQRQETGEAVDENELNEARRRFEESRERLAALLVTRTRDERQLNQRFIRSPGDFIVHAVLVTSNQQVTAGHILMELAPAPPP